MADFAKIIAEGYAVEGPAIELGRGVFEGELVQEAAVRIPLAMMNRHGLIAGATGTGKTRTLQGLAEPLSANGVPCLVEQAPLVVGAPGLRQLHLVENSEPHGCAPPREENILHNPCGRPEP